MDGDYLKNKKMKPEKDKIGRSIWTANIAQRHLRMYLPPVKKLNWFIWMLKKEKTLNFGVSFNLFTKNNKKILIHQGTQIYKCYPNVKMKLNRTTQHIKCLNLP